jgi:hypothetical protein
MKTIKALLFSFLLNALLLPLCAAAATIHGATDADVVWVSAPRATPKPIDEVVTNQNRSFTAN